MLVAFAEYSLHFNAFCIICRSSQTKTSVPLEFEMNKSWNVCCTYSLELPWWQFWQVPTLFAFKGCLKKVFPDEFLLLTPSYVHRPELRGEYIVLGANPIGICSGTAFAMTFSFCHNISLMGELFLSKLAGMCHWDILTNCLEFGVLFSRSALVEETCVFCQIKSSYQLLLVTTNNDVWSTKADSSVTLFNSAIHRQRFICV